MSPDHGPVPPRPTQPTQRTQPQQVVGAAIVDDLDRPTTLLAARRTEPESLRGGWELPGGKVEEGEQPREALHREIREELGVEVVLGELLAGPAGEATWPLGERYVIQIWLARVTTGEPRPLEDHDELRTLAKSDLHSVAWLPADLPIVAALDRLLS